jgi:hypothetical protein
MALAFGLAAQNEAKAQFTRAAALGLPPAEKAELARMSHI